MIFKISVLKLIWKTNPELKWNLFDKIWNSNGDFCNADLHSIHIVQIAAAHIVDRRQIQNTYCSNSYRTHRQTTWRLNPSYKHLLWEHIAKCDFLLWNVGSVSYISSLLTCQGKWRTMLIFHILPTVKWKAWNRRGRLSWGPLVGYVHQNDYEQVKI